jgi:hypothetical protein
LAALNHFTVPFSLIPNLLKNSQPTSHPERLRIENEKGLPQLAPRSPVNDLDYRHAPGTISYGLSITWRTGTNVAFHPKPPDLPAGRRIYGMAIA